MCSDALWLLLLFEVEQSVELCWRLSHFDFVAESSTVVMKTDLNGSSESLENTPKELEQNENEIVYSCIINTSALTSLWFGI